MRSTATLLLILLATVGIVACESRTDRTDSGGVLIELEFSTFPIVVSVNQSVRVSVDEMVLTSIPVDPDGVFSDLMDVQIDTMEISYRRADGGTRTPPPLVQQLVGRLPVNGTLTYTGLNIASVEQMRNPPLSDLLFVNGGFDKETGSSIIRLDVIIRFFGQTLTGDDVASVPRAHTLEFQV